MPSLKTSTCLLALVGLSRAKQDETSLSWLGFSGEFKNIPQFFRFNQHYDLEVTFDNPEQGADDLSVPKRKSLRDFDSNFSHLFKELKSEYLIDGDDGNYIQMECSTWLDISADESNNKSSSPEWKTDLSLVKSSDSRNVPYMTKLTEP